MTRAYSDDYLYYAQKNMGHMLDFAVNSCDIEPDKFIAMFLTSSVAEQFESGNSAYLTGMSGCELVRVIVKETTDTEITAEDNIYIDKSPEYWTGWAICYYQWYSCRPFKNIFDAVSVNTVIGMYNTLHEADISKFIETMDKLISDFYKETALARQRKISGMTQSELAEVSGVSVRIIQKYEQKKNDINSAKVSTLLSLSKALHCKIEDLMEY